ncbi:MAG: hypothetical protein AAF548_10990 [Actinomycetota bacterium]
MTEVPEHLLKKAAEARARLTGEGGDTAPADEAPAAEAAPAAAAPVPAAAAAVPAEPEPEPEVPDAPYVAAAKARKTIPVWVMPVLLFLPFWAIYYVGYLENPPVTGGLAFEGEEMYVTCAGCHGGGGGGGSGRQLNDGEVLRTFPVGITADGYDGLAGMIAWVANGSELTRSLEGMSTYGDPAREGGPHVIAGELGPMSGFGAIWDVEQLASAVFHERSQFGGDLIDADLIVEELELLEEFIHVAEEDGIEHLDGMTVAQISEMLDAARAKVGGDEAAAE